MICNQIGISPVSREIFQCPYTYHLFIYNYVRLLHKLVNQHYSVQCGVYRRIIIMLANEGQ